MSKSLIAAFIGAISLISAAHADPGATAVGTTNTTSATASTQKASDVDTVIISSENRLNTSGNIYKMWPEQFYDFKGTYDLANGMTLTLFNRKIGNLMFAQLDDKERHQIVATSKNTFVALDKKLGITINQTDTGKVSGHVLMLIPAEIQANGSVIGEHLVTSAFN